jgi:hypothetical protein
MNYISYNHHTGRGLRFIYTHHVWRPEREWIVVYNGAGSYGIWLFFSFEFPICYISFSVLLPERKMAV